MLVLRLRSSLSVNFSLVAKISIAGSYLAIPNDPYRLVHTQSNSTHRGQTEPNNASLACLEAHATPIIGTKTATALLPIPPPIRRHPRRRRVRLSCRALGTRTHTKRTKKRLSPASDIRRRCPSGRGQRVNLSKRIYASLRTYPLVSILFSFFLSSLEIWVKKAYALYTLLVSIIYFLHPSIFFALLLQLPPFRSWCLDGIADGVIT